MSYIEFFGFKENPFRITPDITFFYSAPSHAEALQSLHYFCKSDEGFMVIVGEPGTGKTITLRKFLNEIPEDVEYAYILFPSLEPEDMFRAVLEDFGFTIDTGISKNTLFSRFRDFLTEKKKQGKRLLLVIDEAQNLPVRTLEELRILSNLETEKEKLIQFILAGQPELEKKLSSAELRQMKQRVTLHVPLKRMDFNEMCKYVAFRLSEAGFQGQYPDTAFYNVLYSITDGIPRLINLMMERTLMAAFVDQSKLLTPAHLNSAAISLRLQPAKKSNKAAVIAVAAIIGLLAVGGIGYYYKARTARAQYVKQTAVEMQKPQEQAKPAVKPAQKPAAGQTVKQPAEPVQKSTAPIKPEQKKPAAVTAAKQKKAEPATVKTAPEKDEQTQQPDVPETIAAGSRGVINANILNIRQSPDLTSDVVFKARAGQPVTVKDVDGDWLMVSYNGNNGVDTGWVFRKYIRLK